METSFFSKVKIYFSNFRIRFSHFLLLGIIGSILQAISYFVASSGTTSFSKLYASKMSSEFKNYIAPSYVLFFSAILLIVAAVGFIKCAKKKDTYVKLGGYTLIAGESIIAIACVASIICLYVSRTKLKNNNVNSIIYVLSSFKLLGYIVSSSSFMFLGIGMRKAKNQDDIGQAGIYSVLLGNGLFLIFTFVLIVASIGTKSLDSYFCYYANTNVDAAYRTINGLSFGQLRGLNETISIAYSYGDSSLRFFGIVGFIYQIVYLIGIVATLVFILSVFVQSYDVSKDEDRMSL